VPYLYCIMRRLPMAPCLSNMWYLDYTAVRIHRITKTKMKHNKAERRGRPSHLAVRMLALAVALLVGAVGSLLLRPSDAAVSGGSGGPQTDRTNLTYTANGVTSKYHLYAAGLDWTKQVGLLIYADGSGEFGLKNPSNSYLLAGKDGMINVAKRNNMVLLTPLAPGSACPDGGGTCWYENSSGITTTQKVQWAEALVKYVQSQYPIELNRVAMGGYSSGAQLATQYWTASGAAQRTMTDGVIVSISCGGSPSASSYPLSSEVAYTADFKANVPMYWNIGDKDLDASYGCPYKADYSATGGYNHFTAKGFQTKLDIIPGLTHDRDDFGIVMETQIKLHVPPASGTVTPPGPPPTNPPPPPGPNPTPKTGDLNGDGKVNVTDLSTLLTNWGKSGVTADLNGSGKVDISDLSVLLSNWG